MHKKGNVAVVIVLAIVILAIVLVDYFGRDCNNNRECSQDAYCGSDHQCHEYPKEIVVKQNNYVSAAIILGIALIVAAYIFRGGKIIPNAK